jgi:hypothetical protein
MPMKKSSGSELVTKGYLDKKLDELEGRISRRVNSQFVDFEEKVGRKIEDSITNAMGKFYERVDTILAQVENARIDREMTTQKLEDLDKRVTKLETS